MYRHAYSHVHIHITHTNVIRKTHCARQGTAVCCLFFLECTSSQSEALVHGQKHSKSLTNVFVLNKKIDKSKTWIPSSLVRSSNPSATGKAVLKSGNAGERHQSDQPGWHIAHGVLNIEAPYESVLTTESTSLMVTENTWVAWVTTHCIQNFHHTSLWHWPMGPKECATNQQTPALVIFFLMPQTDLCQQPIILSQRNIHTSLWTRLGL